MLQGLIVVGGKVLSVMNSGSFLIFVRAVFRIGREFVQCDVLHLLFRRLLHLVEAVPDSQLDVNADVAAGVGVGVGVSSGLFPSTAR